MVIKDIRGLTERVQKLYVVNGVNDGQAWELAEILVEATMLGLHSHGLYRAGMYYGMLKNGSIVANAPIEVIHNNRAVAVVNGNWNFGHLTAKAAANIAVGLAKEYGIGCCTTKKAHHIGALSVYTRIIASKGCAALGYCGVNGNGYFVAPHGGREGRMATNPISFAAPTDELPFSTDFSTSMTSEGKLQLLRQSGGKIPPNLAIDHTGRPVTDPNDYYDPQKGAILPLGESQGYKGTALSMMTQILSCLLSGGNWRPFPSEDTEGNALLLIAIDITHFNDLDYFKSELREYAAFIRTSEPLPGFNEIMLPGDLENKTWRDSQANGLSIDDVTWQGLKSLWDAYSIDYAELR